MLSSLPLSLLFSALFQFQKVSASGASYTVSIPPAAPTNAIEVPADFFGFGYETAFLPHFDNAFSENMVNAIGSRMSKPLIIRIGGTSGDLVKVDLEQKEPAICVKGPSCPLSSQDTFTLGKAYFEVFKKFPNASMTIQAPMGDGMEMNNTMAYVRNAWQNLGHDRVAAIALGNEPNYYSWNAEEYVRHALEVESNITKEFNLQGEEARIFELGDIANDAAVSGNKYDITQVFDDHIDQNSQGKFAAEHYYQLNKNLAVYNEANLQQHVMNHTAILEHLASYEKSMQAVHQHHANLSFVLSEVGSVIGGGPTNFSGGFGAAIWAADFHLAAMARGIKRVSNTQRPEASHAFWIPDNSGPKTGRPVVQGIFPAAPFVADFVGKDASLGKVVELGVNGQGLFTAYAMYGLHSEKIERVALVNLQQWDASSKTTRGNKTVTLSVGNGVKSAVIRRLHADQGWSALGYDLGGAQENVTWAGEQWTYAVDQGMGHFPTGSMEQESVAVNGTVKVSVPDTEAVIVFFE
ncbi:hypothetical protein BGW36DRAFT_216876 [Talaromyces proteolyticus]|uniref:Beta-glucuronidase C-terminal domain-containing protein n=1 Tax=Talaromyces proteolyticus TaxID=1131652 RepID=A0AAD4PW30_9EURO|nr:uncharacterized protein BGW36DRAFT_216876 [Talaromyces proteolyticus]KAH8694132.1 hypothetical protein BGW36DRAFT_216876 [Talaromyces proteolyticus]